MKNPLTIPCWHAASEYDRGDAVMVAETADGTLEWLTGTIIGKITGAAFVPEPEYDVRLDTNGRILNRRLARDLRQMSTSPVPPQPALPFLPAPEAA